MNFPKNLKDIRKKREYVVEMKYHGVRNGESVKLRKIKKSLSQVDLAAEVGVKQPVINKWERGKVTPTIESLCKLCKALSCEPNDLLKGDY